MKKILALWATVRSTSTAFEMMMRQRGDFLAFHEPFGLSYYNSQERRNTNRYPEIELNPEYNYQKTWQKLRQQADSQAIFIKDMAYYVIHLAEGEFLSAFENTFLLRHPAKMLPSLYDLWPDFTLEETGYAELYNLFEIAKKISGKVPVVIDSDDLVQKPEATVKAYCDAVNIPFIKEALEWEAKQRPEMTHWDGGNWLTEVISSRGLQQPKKKNYVAVEDNEHLQRAYQFCLPYYEKLQEHKLPIA